MFSLNYNNTCGQRTFDMNLSYNKMKIICEFPREIVSTLPYNTLEYGYICGNFKLIGGDLTIIVIEESGFDIDIDIVKDMIKQSINLLNIISSANNSL